MNRLVLAALALVAVGGGTFYYVLTRPSVGPGDGVPPLSGSASVDPTAIPTQRTELVDPKVQPTARATLERPEVAVQASDPAGKTKPAPGPLQPDSLRSAPGMPSSLPATEDADDTAFVDKYANATPDERRQALESLALTYKDAASGRIKNSEQLLKELEIEMQWLEGHLDP